MFRWKRHSPSNTSTRSSKACLGTARLTDTNLTCSSPRHYTDSRKACSSTASSIRSKAGQSNKHQGQPTACLHLKVSRSSGSKPGGAIQECYHPQDWTEAPATTKGSTHRTTVSSFQTKVQTTTSRSVAMRPVNTWKWAMGTQHQARSGKQKRTLQRQILCSRDRSPTQYPLRPIQRNGKLKTIRRRMIPWTRDRS